MKIAIRGEGPTDIGELAYDGSLQKGPSEKLQRIHEFI
jgi:hypothetical protein